jgi:inner membrane protein
VENLTHTLIGLAAGESFVRCTRSAESLETGRGLPQAARRSLFVTLAAIGGNAPDVDLAWSYGRSDGTLGYMLEHRGYTHTVLGCLVLAGLLYAGAEWWMRQRDLRPSGRDRVHLALVVVFGTLLHLAMDALNSYGVHPFWPLDNRWFYGDSMFIAEPLFWLASAPLIFLMRSWPARVLMSLAVLSALVGAVWIHPGALAWHVAIVVAAAGLVAVGHRASPRAAALTSAGAMALVVGVSVICGTVAVTRMNSIADSSFPGYRTLDHILTPTPTYPLCWDVLVLSIQDDRYAIRHAVLSVAPEIVAAARCPEIFTQRPTNPAPSRRSASTTARTTAVARMLPPAPARTRVSGPDSASIQWLEEFSMSREQLVALVQGHCDAAALMQFARAPFAFQYGRAWLLGDLRFERGAGFRIELRDDGPSAACSIRVPWIAPRMDLLHPQG